MPAKLPRSGCAARYFAWRSVSGLAVENALILFAFGLPFGTGNACLQESQHLVERPCKMHRRALRENVRVLAIAAEPEAEPAQKELAGVRHLWIATVHREAREHA
jgi:hypothetical protein